MIISKKSMLAKYNILVQLFDLYKNYKFKVNNYKLFELNNLEIDKNILETMKLFIKLTEIILEEITIEEKKMAIELFIENKHYSLFNCSQSSFFVKRNKLCKKLYDLFFDSETHVALKQLFYLIDNK